MPAEYLTDEVLALSDEELKNKIKEIKQHYGKELIILGHHYQRQEILDFADYRGDSLRLAQIVSEQHTARYIVFCGVHFMAESAAILAHPHQMVIHPAPEAGCPLADFAQITDVEVCWQQLKNLQLAETTIPLTYINSSVEIKAFCGRHSGACCTSSNAQRVIRWALGITNRIIFMPDENLGRNVTRILDIPESQVKVWDPSRPLGGLTPEEIQHCKVLLWRGYCHVHTYFTPEHIRQWREREPDAKIIVHPECPPEVVALVDATGSTEQIIRFVTQQPSGATIVIGTELNLVERLARENPDKRIFELARSLCPNMFKINLPKLYWSLKNLGKINVITIPEKLKAEARKALMRMLEIT
ncbi:MAG: quinolinate synthase NadA [Candidatus Sumerlaeia bacterium]|nr:quinolinate synthase NadA [Candidatus Sumerlaeia bacterium]